MSERKVDPAGFREMYAAGWKMSVIAMFFGASLRQCKDMRRRLGIPPRSACRPRLER